MITASRNLWNRAAEGVTLKGVAMSLGVHDLLKLFFVAMLFVLLSTSLAAQSSSGSIIGTVTDASGGSIPSATVTVINLGTNERKTAKADGSGNFSFVELIPSNYTVQVSSTGYKGFSRSPVPVQTGTAVRVDTQLQIGVATETVTVTTAPPLLQTDSGTLNTVIEGKQVEEMPLNGRDIMNLIALVPGVTPQGTTSGSTSLNAGTHSSNYFANYQIGGGAAGQSAILIDGVPINVLGTNNPALVPTQDSIQEFSVASNVPSAEFGRFAGGVVQMSTKSGSNGYHGTAYEYLRNNFLNANNFFTKAAGQPRAHWNVNQFGAAIGGPVKKDKAFFFASGESLRDTLGIASSTFVPSYNMEQGIFSKKVVDPTGNCPIDSTSMPGKYIVPKSCFDSTAVILEGEFPAPNPATPDQTAYYSTPTVASNQYQLTGRLDSNFSDKQRLFARYTYWNIKDQPIKLFAASTTALPSSKSSNLNLTHQAVLGDTYVFNPSTILDVRASYLRQFYANNPPTLGWNPATIGPGFVALNNLSSFKEIPRVAFSGADSFALAGTSVLSADYWDQYSLAASVVKIIGNHTVKLGGEVRQLQRNDFNGNPNDLGGNFTFNSATTGDEFAGFLMGVYQTASITAVKKVGNRETVQGYYLTDTWQASRNLTLNMGLRWELPGGFTEKHDQNTVILPNTLDPVTGQKGAVVAVNSPLYKSRSSMPVKLDLFAPRFSFAYRLPKSTVISGGYGLTYLPPDIIYGSLATVSPVNSANTAITTPQYHGLQNPFGVLTGGTITLPVYLPPGATTPSPFITAFKNQAVTSNVPTNNFPNAQQFNLSISHEFRGSFLTEVSYAGSKGTHLPGLPASINELSSQYYPALQAMLTAGASSASIIAAGQAERTYPYFKNLINSAPEMYSSGYNSLQVKSQKRFSNGAILMAIYTWSKTIGNAEAVGEPEGTTGGGNVNGSGGYLQDFNNPSGDSSITSFDAPQRAVINYVLPLPFGKGQRYGSGVSGLTDKLVSGWAFNGITTFESGFPLGIYESSGNYLTLQFGGGVLRPNVVPGCNKHTGGSAFHKYQTNTWFNAGCFTFPGQFAFGNQPRNDGAARQQGIDNFDFSVLKSTKFGERIDAQFRAEFFNLFNHTQFASPGLGIGGALFDQVNAQGNNPRLGQLSLRLLF